MDSVLEHVGAERNFIFTEEGEKIRSFVARNVTKRKLIPKV